MILCFGVSLEHGNRLKVCVIFSEIGGDFRSHLGLYLLGHFREDSGWIIIRLSLNANDIDFAARRLVSVLEVPGDEPNGRP